MIADFVEFIGRLFLFAVALAFAALTFAFWAAIGIIVYSLAHYVLTGSLPFL